MTVNNEPVRTIRRSCDESQVTGQVIDHVTGSLVTKKGKVKEK